MLHAIASAFIGVATFISSLFGAHQQDLGASLPQGTAVFETSLQSRISSTDTSLTLTANSVRGGTTLSGYNCFTLDEGRTDAEYVCGSVSGTSVTGLTRGIDPQTGTTSNSSLKFAHRVGANVKITDFPLIQILRNQANGAETYPYILNYVYSPNYTNASTTAIASKGYVDSVALVSAPNSDDTTKGVVETATAAEAAAGTSLGSTGARLALGANIATSTCQSAANRVLVASSTSGKLDGRCLDISNANTWTGGQTFTNATTSAFGISGPAVAIDGINYRFPATQGASSTALSTDGNGGLTWEPQQAKTSVNSSVQQSTSSGASTTLATIAIPANTLTTTQRIQAQFVSNVQGTGGSPGCSYEVDYGTGAATTTLISFTDPVGGGSPLSLNFITSQIIATTTTSEEAFSTATANQLPGTNFALASNLWQGKMSLAPYNTASATYLAFVAKLYSGSGNCLLSSQSVQVISQ